MALMEHDVLSIADGQLETAGRLYRAGKDYYSVITLAGAAEEIYGKLLKHHGGEPALESLAKCVSALHKIDYGEDLPDKEIYCLANEARNSLKHWSASDPKLEFDAKREAEDMLERAVRNREKLTDAFLPTHYTSRLDN